MSDTGDDCVTIMVSGDFSFSLNKMFQKVMEKYPRGEHCFAIDLSEVQELDSSALGILLQLRDHSRAGEKVRLVNPQPPIAALLRETQFPNLFIIDEG